MCHNMLTHTVVAPSAGIEPATSKLTVSRSASELRENMRLFCVLPLHIVMLSQCIHFLQNLLTRMQKYVVNAVSVSTDHQTYSNIVFKRYGQLLPPCTELNTSDHNIEKSFSSPHKRRSYLELSALIVTVRKREYEYAYSYHSTIIVKL